MNRTVDYLALTDGDDICGCFWVEFVESKLMSGDLQWDGWTEVLSASFFMIKDESSGCLTGVLALRTSSAFHYTNSSVEPQAALNKMAWFLGSVFFLSLPPSSASVSSTEDMETPSSRHFFIWALDFMCFVRFPSKQTQTQFSESPINWKPELVWLHQHQSKKEKSGSTASETTVLYLKNCILLLYNVI